jgi:hypothetical protein
MVLRSLVLAAAIVALAAPALAFHCPLDMKKIDAALAQNPPLTAEQLAEIKERRAEGERLHNAGDHGAAVETLGKALEILAVK